MVFTNGHNIYLAGTLGTNSDISTGLSSCFLIDIWVQRTPLKLSLASGYGFNVCIINNLLEPKEQFMRLEYADYPLYTLSCSFHSKFNMATHICI